MKPKEAQQSAQKKISRKTLLSLKQHLMEQNFHQEQLQHFVIYKT